MSIFHGSQDWMPPKNIGLSMALRLRIYWNSAGPGQHCEYL